MAAHRARIRSNMAASSSHFEQSLRELNASKRGSVGRSAHVAPVLAEDEESDLLRELNILRKATLSQEQWDTYLGAADEKRPGAAAAAASSRDAAGENAALLGRKSRDSGTFRSDSAVTSRKKTTFDVEAGDRSQRPRSGRSVFGLPLAAPTERWVLAWTQVVLALDLSYTAFLVPILVGFQVSDVDWGWGCIIDFIAGFLFTVELAVSFHVGFIGKHGTRRRLVMDGRAVAWYYCRHGHFFVDVLTSGVWLAQIGFIVAYHTGRRGLDDGVATKVYQAVRVLRLVRFTSLLRRLYATAAVAQQSILPGLRVSHATANFFNVCFGGAVLANFLACLWNFTALAEGAGNSWIAYYSVLIREFGSEDSVSNGQLSEAEALGIPGWRRYLVGFYYVLVTIGTVGYGDIYPQTTPEEFVAIFIILTGLVMFSIVLASIAEALQRLSQDAKAALLFRGRIEAVDKWMSARKLPLKLRVSIAAYYAEDWLYGADAGEEVQVMTELPQGLRKEIALCINAPLFKRLHFFDGFPEGILAGIAAHMAPLQLPAGFELCEEGDAADCFWVLHDGAVAAVSYSSPERNATLKAPALVGQVALLQEQDGQYALRQCTYRTNTSCLLWEVPLREVLPLLRLHPNLYQLASQQALPNHYFDYLAINPAATFEGSRPSKQAADEAAAADASVRSGTSYKELEETMLASAGAGLAQKSANALASRGSTGVTRSELKRAELKRAKSMAPR